MKNKIIIAFLFALTFIFIGTSKVNALSSYYVNLNYNQVSMSNMEKYLPTLMQTFRSSSTMYIITNPSYVNSGTGECFQTVVDGYSSCSVSIIKGDVLSIKTRNRSGYASGIYFSGTNVSSYEDLLLYRNDTTGIIYMNDKTTVLDQSVFPSNSWWGRVRTSMSSTYFFKYFTYTSWTSFPLTLINPNIFDTNASFVNINDTYDFDLKINDTIYSGDDSATFPSWSSVYNSIPDIDVDLSISSKLKDGSYDVTLNIIPAKKGWYVEILDVIGGNTLTFEINDDLQLYGQMFMNIVDDTLYNIKIYKDKTKEVLYYEKTINAVINEDSTHIAIDDFKYNNDNTYTIKYHYANTGIPHDCYYSLNDLTWVKESCSDFTAVSPKVYTGSANGFFGIKIDDRLKGNVDLYTLNLSPDKSSPYILFEGGFSIANAEYRVHYSVFNYLESDYLYYSIDNVNWIPLSKFDDTLKFYFNTILYFKLEDINHVLKYSTIYEIKSNFSGNYLVDESNDDSISSIHGKLLQFMTPVNYIVDRVVDLYNILPNKVQDFFFISFLLGIIVIVIKIVT